MSNTSYVLPENVKSLLPKDGIVKVTASNKRKVTIAFTDSVNMDIKTSELGAYIIRSGDNLVFDPVTLELKEVQGLGGVKTGSESGTRGCAGVAKPVIM